MWHSIKCFAEGGTDKNLPHFLCLEYHLSKKDIGLGWHALSLVNVLDTLSCFPFTSKLFFYHFLAEAVPKPPDTEAGARGELPSPLYFTPLFFSYLLFLFNNLHFNKAFAPGMPGRCLSTPR